MVAHGSRGTFVAERLPNVASFALVFADEQAKGGWNRFWSTVLREGQSWRDAAGRGFVPYFIAGADVRAADHRRLCDDLTAGRLAGILYVSTPWYLADSPVMAARLPRVVIGGTSDDVALHGGSVIEWVEGIGPSARLCHQLIRDGRKRIAALVHRGFSEQWREGLAEAQRAGLESRRSWWLGITPDPAGAVTARGIVRLLLDRPAAERPDILFIGDDNLVPHATAGILDMSDLGIVVPRDLGVVAHANYPNPTRSAVPCRRFGIDARVLLEHALAEMEVLRSGAAPRWIHIEPATNDETGEGLSS